MGRYTVIYNTRTDSGQAVFLEDFWTGDITELLKFDRAVDILWAPDGNTLAIRDWMTREASTIWIVEPRRPSELLDLRVVSRQFLGNDPMTTKNEPVYYEALRWKSPRILVFKISGRGNHDPAGFEDFFEYGLGGTVSRIDR